MAVDLVHEVDRSPAEAIVRFAKTKDCDLIVMSSHRMVHTLGDLIAALDRPGVAEGVLATLDAALAARIEARAAEVSMSASDFAAGAVHAFIEQADDDLWFQLMTVIRKSEDPGLSAVQAILRWAVTEPEAEVDGSSQNAR